jgi:ppGpp synthetase/RelA/SpoT-type nucleotidyltranferase
MSTDGPSTASGTASAHVEEPSGEALEVVVAEEVVATEVSGVQVAFDFDDHRRKAVEAYEKVRRRYEDCAESVYTVLKTTLALESLKVHTIEPRAKASDSFGRKAATPAEDDPDRPKYDDPLGEITDLAGVRVITYLLEDVERVNTVIEREFEIVEKSNKSGFLEEEQKLGYQSIHYLVRFSEPRSLLPEYRRFVHMVTEIQVRTILQHAWAEIEHDIQYKAVEEIPRSIRGRFTSLAGLLEIADREFQAISDEDRRARNDARRLVAQGNLDGVEVTSDALKAYLDVRLGPDGRMTDFSYAYTTRLLRRLGFENLGQVRDALGDYDDDQISRTMWGSRQGQLSRFEDTLLVSMGDAYLDRHPAPWARDDSDAPWTLRGRLKNAEAAEITIGSYLPR